MENREIELLTVQEFAKRAGVTTQWIYKQLRRKDEISRFVIHSDGKIKINAEGLELYRQNTSTSENTEHADSEIIALLREQLQAKDRQIENLQEMVKAEQQLRAVAEQRILRLEGGKQEQAENNTPTEEKPVKNDSAESEGHTVAEDTPQPAQTETPTEPAQKKRGGLFGWLFG